jgi:hypothetical protein
VTLLPLPLTCTVVDDVAVVDVLGATDNDDDAFVTEDIVAAINNNLSDHPKLSMGGAHHTDDIKTNNEEGAKVTMI